MTDYHALAYIMKSPDGSTPPSNLLGNQGNVLLANSNGGITSDETIHFHYDSDMSMNILGVTGQIQTTRLIFDNSNVAIGYQAGYTGQSNNGIAIGYQAGYSGQSSNAIAIGYQAGMTGQGTNAVALGYQAGLYDQSSNAIAIGYQAGMTGQGTNAVALGNQAGMTGQRLNAIAIGYQSGLYDQSSNAIAIGYQAGMTGQSANAIAIGYQAGMTGQSLNSVALGYQAGMTGQGENTIAIGYQAGTGDQAANTIILNATDASLNSVGDASACYIKPIRNVDTDYNSYEPLAYNKSTGELVSGNNVGFQMITDSFSVTGGGGTGGGDDKLFAYSYDGITWSQDESTTANRTFTDGSCNAIAYDGSVWLAGGVGENAIVHSANGISWERNDDNARSVLDSGNWRAPVDISYSLTGTGESEAFGTSLALNSRGNRMAVGAPNFTSSDISGVVAIYDFSFNSDAWIKTFDISGGSTTLSERFGASVVMDGSGTRIAVGAPHYGTGADDGRVYTFDCSYNDDSFNPLSTLWGNGIEIPKPSNSIVDEKFGSTIAINVAGTRLLIGAHNSDTNRGAVYDYSYNQGTWNKSAVELKSSDIQINHNFGYSIAMNAAGTRCLIGEPDNGTGHVYGYDFSMSTGVWGLTTTGTSAVADQDLSYNPLLFDASFGHAITMNDAGNWCAVGAPTAGSGGLGRVGIYQNNYREWGLYTDIPGQVAGENFGSSVAMNGVGDRLIIGAKKNSGEPGPKGKNYVYNYNANTLTWEYERVISSNVLTDGNEGTALAIDTLGNRFVSGAPTGDGSVAVYDRQMKCNALTAHGGNWIGGGNAVRVEEDTPFAYSADGITNWQAAAKGKEQAILRKELCYALDGSQNYFGSRCDMNAAGTRLVVGSPSANVGGNEYQGRVCIYDYDMSLNDWISEPTKVYEEGQGINSRFGSDVALNAAGDILVVGWSSYDDGENFNYGRVYIYHYDYSNDQWPDSPTRYYRGDSTDNDFGYSVVINAQGDRIAVGAPTDDDGGTDSGSVFIIDYDHSAGVWPSSDGTPASSITGRIKIYSGTAGYKVGTSISFNAAGDVLAIGAPHFLHITERDNTTGQWGRLTSPFFTGTTFTLNDGVTSYGFTNGVNNFGWKVSLNAKGDRLAVSNYTYANSNNIGGRVYIIDYDYDKKTWPSGTQPSDIDVAPINSVYTSGFYGHTVPIDVSYNCGYSLKLNAAGDRLLIGETANNVYGTNRGALHVIDYNKETGQWPTAGPPTNVATYSFYGTNNDDHFGGSCAMNALGNRIAVGASMYGVNYELDDVTNASDKYGTDNGYVRLYDLLTLPIQLEDCRALTTFNGNLIAGGKGNGGHIFALSDDNGVTWKNNQMNEDRLFKYDWSGNPLTFPIDKVSNFTHEFFGDTNYAQQAFGYACKINYDGTRCVIASRYHSSNAGALFFFHNDDGYGWKLNTQFINPKAGGELGLNASTMSMNDAGTRVIAAAILNDYNGGASGSVFIFDYYNGVWNNTKRIDGDAANYFLGLSCAMNGVGDRFIIGERAYYQVRQGRAHIYHLINNDWRLMKTYSEGSTEGYASDPPKNNYKFGEFVTMNGIGDRVVISAPTDGNIYIYDYVNGAWGAVHSHLILQSDIFVGDMNSLGDRFIIAEQTIRPFSVYIYHYNASGNWTPVQTYTGESNTSNYGNYVTMDASGDRILIGDELNENGKGAAYLYSYVNGAWPATKFDYDVSFAGVTAGDVLGIAAALTGLGHKVLIGATMYNTANYGRGYLYDAVRSSETSDIYCNALAVKGSNEMIVAGLGGTGVTNPLVWSADGLTWYPSDNGATIFTGSGAVCKAVAWNGSRWVAGGKSSGSGGPLAYSYNGKKWYKSMNGLALLGAASTCNAVSWNGKYWLASVEGASVGSGQTQVYSLNGMSWIASNNGDTLFTSTSQALALATAKEGNDRDTINLESRATTLESRATTLESEVDTLQLTQFGVGQSWYSAGTKDVVYINNTSKTIGISVSMYSTGTGQAIILYVDGQIIASLDTGAESVASDSSIFGLVPPNSSYKVTFTNETYYNIRTFR